MAKARLEFIHINPDLNCDYVIMRITRTAASGVQQYPFDLRMRYDDLHEWAARMLVAADKLEPMA